MYKLSLKLHSSGICQVQVAPLKPQGKYIIALCNHHSLNYGLGLLFPGQQWQSGDSFATCLVFKSATKRPWANTLPQAIYYLICKTHSKGATLLLILQPQLRHPRTLWLPQIKLSSQSVPCTYFYFHLGLPFIVHLPLYWTTKPLKTASILLISIAPISPIKEVFNKFLLFMWNDYSTQQCLGYSNSLIHINYWQFSFALLEISLVFILVSPFCH